jgi:hypothetical protein
VGACNRNVFSELGVSDEEYEISASDVGEMQVAARGVDEYRSWVSVRPKSITGRVAYTGIRVKRGKVLQQCA